MVDGDLVDRPNRRLGIGVGGQQHAFGVGEKGHRLGQKAHAVHDRHPLIDQKERYGVVTTFKFAHRPQRRLAAGGPHDAVVFAVTPPEVTAHRAQNLGVVVYAENNGLAI